MNKTLSKILTLLLLIFSNYLFATQTIKVGVYENYPKIFTDTNGKVSGFFPQILDHIAQKNKLTIEYIPCTWSDCLDKLENGSIDLMPDVAYTQERNQCFLFSNETLLNNWSVVYHSKDLVLESLFDFNGKSIAVLKNSVQESELIATIEKLHLKPKEMIQTTNFDQSFGLLEEKKVDIVIVNQFFYLNHTIPKNITKANFIFAPSILKLAFHKEQKQLTNLFDNELKILKKDKNSIYYKALEIWLPKEKEPLPKWIIDTIVILVVVLIALTILVFIFRKMVIDRSNKLIEKDKMLFMQSKNAALGEMISLIAHQWRQPLSVISVISTNIDLKIDLGEPMSDKEIKQSMNDINQNIKFVNDTLNDFRNFYRPDKVKQEVSIQNVIDAVKQLLSARIKGTNITIRSQIEFDHPINVYQSDLMHVILIILNNAIDILLEKNPPTPSIKIVVKEDLSSIIIEITDNGGGIPNELLSKIAQPYFTTKDEKGTGIGLYTVQTLLPEHFNGTLTWCNKNQGACFIIKFEK